MAGQVFACAGKEGLKASALGTRYPGRKKEKRDLSTTLELTNKNTLDTGLRRYDKKTGMTFSLSYRYRIKSGMTDPVSRMNKGKTSGFPAELY